MKQVGLVKQVGLEKDHDSTAFQLGMGTGLVEILETSLYNLKLEELKADTVKSGIRGGFGVAAFFK